MTDAVAFTVGDVVLPEDVIERLQNNTHTEDVARWDDGRICEELVDEFGEQYGKMLVRKRVAIEAGLGLSTIRQREEMARFYPEEVVEQYEILTWSQLRACKPAGETGWQDLADWAVKSADDFGVRPAPVDAIVARRLGPDPETKTWEEPFLRVYRGSERLKLENGIPKKIRDAADTFVEATDRWYKQLT